ncbi:hypothetical protein [Micromonospora aurantiaca (nom. illeg.)]|uniref:hypothetical protein n=1 Tax=Micromonospora aurantiaca (nom. illeg.) TaxID=47850 RepID=UPI000828F9E1|nr:hypothetical protein [Micromonospora aurantiaca]SCL21343.1 hypothetical protein GA0070615_0048 [Micromonospora aurantiaca]SCL21483.1 hypothetical protein GA0070615_0083 [Micromonospora aurantiaca]SCL21519.1 hypothetical protein GA0070615_0090 [Micromonospora aurantiaca]SCL21546.1 hypothetical protein GA0070615_0095 [Micromonospora aurantiaca]
MDDVSVRIILDTSAVIAFTRERIDVGEVIAEVADEPGSAFGLPVLCLAEAARVVDDSARLDLLVNHHAALVLTPDPVSWRALAITHDTVGRLDAASAVLAAIDLGCDVLTGQPGLYAGLAGGGPVIAF